MIESIQETCHCLLMIFFDIGSYHGNLHFLIVFFDHLHALLEELQLLDEILGVVCRHEASSHDVLHLCPSRDGWLVLLATSLDDLIPPNEDIVLELEGCHGDLLFLVIVVKTEYLVDFQCP